MRMNIKLEKYKIAIEMMKHENSILWQTYSIFTAANLILLGMFLKEIIITPFFSCQPNLFIISIVGLIFSAVWMFLVFRQVKYFELRMAQARNAEPPGWNILVNTGQRFSKGEQVTIGRENYRLGLLAGIWKRLKLKWALPIIVVIIFLCAIFLYGPWWPNKPRKIQNEIKLVCPFGDGISESRFMREIYHCSHTNKKVDNNLSGYHYMITMLY